VMEPGVTNVSPTILTDDQTLDSYEPRLFTVPTKTSLEHWEFKGPFARKAWCCRMRVAVRAYEHVATSDFHDLAFDKGRGVRLCGLVRLHYGYVPF